MDSIFDGAIDGTQILWNDMCFVHRYDFDYLWMRPLIREHAAMGRECCKPWEVLIGKVKQVLSAPNHGISSTGSLIIVSR